MSHMKLKRLLFIGALIALFISCLYMMNQQYDELARYPHELNEEERSLVLERLSVDDINYLVAQKIEPDQFLPYITCDGFELNNTLWYDVAFQTQEEDKTYIVSFINRYKERMEYRFLQDLLTNYSYNVLTRFFDEGDGYLANPRLVVDPQNQFTLLKSNETLYTYEPHDLEIVNDLPHESITSSNDIILHANVADSLRDLMKAAEEINGIAFGDMHITTGYLSYENQILLYNQALEEHGKDVGLYWDMPGRNEEQLGYTVHLALNEAKSDDGEEESEKEETPSENQDAVDTRSDEEKEQTIWLKDNAYKYGFIIRYPKQKEDITKKTYQPFTLRYVGTTLAKQLHDKGQVLEEANLEDVKE